ncbi:MAG: DUF418 domain-containing protein [Bacteroidales bacterium]|nr:DUF418 domain-containing protein [Bacteroidales bacterium]
MTTNYQPLQLNQRVEILDLLRGFALLGIFMVNMPLMNAPFVTEMGKFSLWTDPSNETASWIIRFFFTGKFYTLFSMLFGIGFYFFLRKADETGNSVVPVFRRRLGWLLAIGVLHVVLLWYGDILVFYALYGFLLILFRKKSTKSLIIWAIFIMLLPVLFALLLVLFFQFALSVPEMADEITASFAQGASRLENLIEQTMIVYSSGSFFDIVKIRLVEYQNQLGGLFFFYPNVLAMFLVGLVLARKKVFENLEANKGFFKKLLLFSLVPAIAGNWILARFSASASYVMFEWDIFWVQVGMAVGGPALTFVYISIIAHCYYKGYFKTITNAIAKTGRMALTNYLMQSVIATTIFFSYGLGLYGQVNIWQGMILAVAIYIIQVIWSHYWLKYYRFGPMEWLWRTLTYGKKQKMKL